MNIDKETLLEGLRQLQGLFPAIGLLAAFLLLLPTEVAKLLKVDSIRENYIGWVVLAAVAGLFLWSLTRLKGFWESRTALEDVGDEIQYRSKFAQRNLHTAIRRCSTPERAILIYCLQKDQDVVFLERSNPAAQMLCQRHILKLTDPQPANKVNNDDVVPFAFRLYVFKALKEMTLESNELEQPRRADIDLMVEQIGKIELEVFPSLPNPPLNADAPTSGAPVS